MKKNTEESFTRIPNVMLDALCRIRINGEAQRCLFFIIRKTFGWNKKEDYISLSQFSEGTKIKKPEVIRAIKKLVSMGIVGKIANDQGNTYFVRLEASIWESLANQPIAKPLAKSPIRVGRLANASLANQPHTKDTTTKDTTSSYDVNSREIILTKYLYQKIKENNEYVKEPNYQTWAKHISLMLRVDKIPEEKIRVMIDWCQSDTFWQSNILSTIKLRQKFPQLYGKMKEQYVRELEKHPPIPYFPSAK